ncbi:MAG: prepilin-type N-terminal cleavage/methylation domain-containing protein [Candidatus Woesearchaeota archaeon]
MKRFIFNKSNFGFNLVEVIFVIAISAILMASIGLAVFYFQRNYLSVEQVGQELAGELRLLQSKILAVQDVNGYIPKAITIEIRQGNDIKVHHVRYSGGSCNVYYTYEMNIIKKADIISVLPSNPVYLTYISPSAKFIAINSSSIPSYSYNTVDNSCNPSSGSIISSENVTVKLNNGPQDYYIKIDTKNGSITPTPNP